MTISQAIVEWLSHYKDLTIETNHIKDGADKYGLFKSPTRQVKNYLNLDYEITEYYQLLIRQNSVSEDDRKDSDEFLENLTYWADDFQFEYEYPKLDKNRKILDIEVTGTPYPLQTNSDDSIYQITIKITYSREREDLLCLN